MRGQLFVTGLVSAIFLTGTVFAHEGATGVVKERMDMMENLKSVMKTLAPMVKGQKEMDSQVVIEQAKIIRQNTGEVLLSKFPKDSIHGPSEALPEIWQEWDKFKGYNTKLSELGMALNEAAGDPDAVIATFKAIGGTCGACHKQFKKD
ncbi:c-type cytochrome [Curvivirga sp.]|uniref:c-type cytochrome n=1 Tax=Curvivirga sp. TaxID=2856848 RepID=UPI003B5B56AE